MLSRQVTDGNMEEGSYKEEDDGNTGGAKVKRGKKVVNSCQNLRGGINIRDYLNCKQ